MSYSSSGKPKRNAQAPLESNEDGWKWIMRVMQEQQAITTNLMNCLAQPPPPSPPPEAPDRVFFDFYKFKPRSFVGGDLPLEAES